MIVVDSSALMAIVRKEPSAQACEDCLLEAETVLISAATLAEALIVAQRRGVRDQMVALIEAVSPQVHPVDEALAHRAAEAYGLWGKGVHPAALNYGDCFAYALAAAKPAPLLFVGEDFARTPLRSALQR